MRTGRLLVTLALSLAGCASPPPDQLADPDEAELYGHVLEVARTELDLPDTIVIHPYLAVARDSAGNVTFQLDEFEFEPSAALRLLQLADGAISGCAYDAQGLCTTSSYVVLSQMVRLAERDAAIVVLAVDRSDARRHRQLLVRLRHQGGEWRVTG
jgi:hypothetical protein